MGSNLADRAASDDIRGRSRQVLTAALWTAAFVLLVVAVTLVLSQDAHAIVGGLGETKDENAQSIIGKLKPFMGRIEAVLLWMALPIATIGLIATGLMHISGSPNARRVGANVLIGMLVVLCSEAIAK
ncbi:MAG: hypothetical protein V7607_5471 [Solirubrobacteraceae bacterium]